MQNISSQKFFLYARKSTDVEDKQVLSIEAQLTELRDYAKRENLNIALEFIEKQSAKIPGRPIFNEMMKCIEKGDADSILSWHPDRLARNSIDGGKIIYLLDTGKLASLKFPTFWCDSTSQGKFMLNMAFGQSKYYVDSLSENTKRGLRQKVRNGDYPTLAPVGYINDSRTKTVVVDRKKAKVIRQAFEFYVKGGNRLEDVSNFLAKHNLFSKTGKKIHKSRATSILSNPFYTGLFRYGGELHEGKYEPIISKKLFDQAQEMLKLRGKPDRKPINDPQPFCGLISCASCGMMITGEYKVKKQKNGNVHEYVYYHCTKKNKNVKCAEPCIRQEELDRQLSSEIKKVSLPKDWAVELNRLALQDHGKSAQSLTACVKEKQEKISSISVRLERLLDGYLEQDIERETYLEKKAKFMGEKKSLEEKIIHFEQKRTGWIEPMRDWIKEAENLPKIARENNLFAKKVIAKKVFGSNLRLAARKVVLGELKNGDNSPQTPWAAVAAAREKINKISESLVLVPPPGIGPGLPG